MEHQLMPAQIRVHNLDLEEILGRAVPENLARSVREIGDKLSTNNSPTAV
jgi:hypothetical protein